MSTLLRIFIFISIFMFLYDICYAKTISCYYDSEFTSRNKNIKFENHLDESLSICTHLLFGYVPLEENNKISISGNQVGALNYITNWKKRNPSSKLKVILVVGGDNENFKQRYISLLLNVRSHTTFIDSTKETIDKFKFDGVDLAWKFPENSKQIPAIKNGFTSLIIKMKNKPIRISASAWRRSAYEKYWDVKGIHPHLDFIHLHAFDFALPDKECADFPAPLLFSVTNPNGQSVESKVKWFLQNGAPARKLIIGIPTYGRSWKMIKKGLPPKKACKPDDIFHGEMPYVETCASLKDGHAIKKKDITSKGTYTYLDKYKSWVAFEDEQSVQEKAQYTKNNALGGVAFFDIVRDDFSGKCKRGMSFPLLKAANAVL